MLRLEVVSRSWQLDAVTVVGMESVSLSVPPGEVLGLTGASGAGKSTLLAVAALLDPPTSGSIWWNQEKLSAMTEDQRSDFRCAHIGFIHQSYPMITFLNVMENILVPAAYAGKSRTEVRRRAEALLERVGMAGWGDRDVRTLSGGQRQRVALARALINQPRVLFADEPTAALDRATGEQVLELLWSCVREQGAAMVLATHDPQVAARADRRIHMDSGRLVGATS